jgi:hypothetical protein
VGTRTNSRNTQKINCSTCGQEYTPMCDFMQGRCPHHPSMLDSILSDPYKSRFKNIIDLFKGKSKCK